MSDSLKDAILERLKSVIDPETGADVIRMRLIENLTVTPGGRGAVYLSSLLAGMSYCRDIGAGHQTRGRGSPRGDAAGNYRQRLCERRGIDGVFERDAVNFPVSERR